MDDRKCLPKTRAVSLAFFSTLLLVTNAHAALLNQWGTFTQTSTYVCDGDPCNGTVGVPDIGPTNYAPLTTFSDVTFSDGAFGSAEAHASLSAAPGLSTPILRARSEANSDVGIIAVARGVEAYTYLGTTTRRLDLVTILEGTATNPNNSSLTRVLADVYVMDADAAEAMYPLTGDGILLQSGLATPFQSSIGIGPGAFPFVSGAVSFDVSPGDSFYVFANLATLAFDGGTAVSMNSLTMSFVDDSDLVAASAAVVPVPAAVWLFGAGLVTLIGVGSRKKKKGDRFIFWSSAPL